LVRILVWSCPGEDVFCTLESDDGRRREELFVSAERLQEQRSQPQKTVLGLSPDEDVFCTLETDDGRRT
jgi:hypothetical protein